MAELNIFADHAAPLEALLKAATAAGATAATAFIDDSTGVTVGTRLGKLEQCEQADSAGLTLKVFYGQRSASVSTNDLRVLDPESLAKRAVTIARASTEDEFSGPAASEQLATDLYPIDNDDPDFQIDMQRLQQACRQGEEAALGVPGTTNSEGATAWAQRTRYSIAASNGFMASEQGTVHGLAVTVIAADGDGMVIDSEQTSAVYASDLPAAESIGLAAARKALRQCNSRKIETINDVPVIFEADAARSLLGHLLSAISGNAVALGQSFLTGKLYETVMNAAITVLDEPQLPRGLRSRNFDAEGLPTRPLPLIKNGVLQNYLLGLRSARQLKLQPNGRASGASNVAIMPGQLSPAELMRDIKRGIYITDVMGPGVNTITGDYSRGISGLLIEDGELSGAISEMTVAGTLQHMFATMLAANDLVRKTGIDSPSLRIDGLTLAGK